MNCLRLFVIVLFTASNPVGFAQDLTLSELDAPSIQRQAALEEIESTLVSNEIDYYPELDQIPLPSPIDTFDDGEVDPLLEPSAVGPIAQGTSETPTILEPVTNQEIGDPQETDVIADGAVTDHEQPLAVKFDILLFDNLTITSNETEVIDAVDIDIPSESTPNATGDSNPTEDNQPHENDLETVEETPVTDTPVAETTAVEVAADTEDQPANQTQDVDGEQQTTDLSEETTQDNATGESNPTEDNQPHENDLETIEETTVEDTQVVVDTPVAETPTVETPTVETPTVETPTVETPAVETPAVETPAVETTVVETAAGAEDQPANQTQDADGEQQTTDLSEETTQDNATGESNPTQDNQPHENDLETIEETTVVDTPVTETPLVETAADTEDQPVNQTQDVDGNQQTTDLTEETTQDNNGSEISTIETPEVKAPLNSQEVGESQEANIITDEIVAANQPSFEDTSATDQQNVDTDDQRQISQKTIRTSNPEKVKEILEKFQVFLKKIRNRQAYQLLD